jgi:TolB-like protein/Tfp pilus assembly protein PilF
MAVLYLVTAWLVMQVAEVLIGLSALPEWIGPAVLAVLAIGFPIALMFAWIYEITPEGLKLEKDIDRSASITHITGRRMDFIAIAILTGAVILFAIDKWWVDAPPDKSIAVLAFLNMSGDPEQEYFSDGISEEILNLLAQIPELTVISRSSSFSFKGKDTPIPTVAEQLNVAHVLEGSVRRVGDRVRITAQLIDADSDSHLWSQSYDRELDDIFSVQDEIATAISDALKLKLAVIGGEPGYPTAIQAASREAYDAYLHGRELLHHRNREAIEDAVRHLKRSLRLDENFAPAHAQLAIATMLLTSYVASPRDEMRREAIRHLDRAHALEPDLAEAHGGRALLAIYSYDAEATIEHARNALAANPNYVDAMRWSSRALHRLGRYEEAETMRRRGLVTDPLSITARRGHVNWLAARGRFEEAHELADQLIAQSPAAGYTAHAATSLWSQGKIAEALSWALRTPAGSSVAMFALMNVAEYDEARRISPMRAFWVDAAEGRWDEAIRGAQAYLKLYPDSGPYLTVAAEIFVLAGRIDEALPLYERALEFVPKGRPLPEPIPLAQTMWLAMARRHAGDEEGARAAVQIVRQDHAALRAAGVRDWEQDLAEAMIAAFEHDTDRAIVALESALQRGLRIPGFLHTAIFDNLREEPRIVALRQELDAMLAEEHSKVLQLICFNNPVPDDWQPMPETCEGVVEKQRL